MLTGYAKISRHKRAAKLPSVVLAIIQVAVPSDPLVLTPLRLGSNIVGANNHGQYLHSPSTSSPLNLHVLGDRA